MDTVSFVILIVAVAFVFDYTNGFHDAANSIATVVSTRVLSPRLPPPRSGSISLRQKVTS